jgi:L-ribulose-5-phosphate 3-epimerase UlaE
MIEPIDDVIARLNLPRVCSDYGFTAGYNAMDFQTYGEFASQARKKNPEVLFTKEIMDTEFHAAASKVPKWAPNKRNCWLRVWRMNARVSAYPLEHDDVADHSV